MEKASVLLSRFKNQDSRRLREVVRGDETWLYFFEPDNMLNNQMWVGENNECPMVACRSRSVRRVMYALFFDSDGIVARVSVPENCSVTGTFYRDFVLSAVVNHYQARCPRARVRGIKLHYNNAPAHCSAVVKSYLEEFHIQVLPHPPYSSDLSSCDFWLNRYIKERGQEGGGGGGVLDFHEYPLVDFTLPFIQGRQLFAFPYRKPLQ